MKPTFGTGAPDPVTSSERSSGTPRSPHISVPRSHLRPHRRQEHWTPGAYLPCAASLCCNVVKSNYILLDYDLDRANGRWLECVYYAGERGLAFVRRDRDREKEEEHENIAGYTLGERESESLREGRDRLCLLERKNLDKSNYAWTVATAGGRYVRRAGGRRLRRRWRRTGR